MKIRIVQSGWETFSGNLGGVDFVNGVAEEATSREAARLANIIQIENFDTGHNPSDSQTSLDHRALNGVETAAKTAERYAPIDTTHAEIPVQHTREALEQIASAKGINGLREIAVKFNVKGTSIGKLIDAIMRAQRPGSVPAVAPVVMPGAVVLDTLANPADEVAPAKAS